ncbi:MAG TPA: hypothetical protein VLQ45_15240, partial [Thermoanaerobaculia bacterium]|nr:hypothetical protein [Thermoanaerobaculia bacterium]
HSPVFLAMAEPEQVLCFAQDGKGATDIVRGSEHPNLKDWKRSTGEMGEPGAFPDESFHRLLCNLLRSWFPIRTT